MKYNVTYDVVPYPKGLTKKESANYATWCTT